MTEKSVRDMDDAEKLRHYGPCEFHDLCGGARECAGNTLCRKCAAFFYYWANDKSPNNTAARYHSQNLLRLERLSCLVGKKQQKEARSVLSTKTFKLTFVPGQILGKDKKPKRKKYKR